MQPRQIIKNWPLIVGTVAVVSAVWAFFFIRVTDLKDQRIALLEQEKRGGGVSNYIKSIDERLARLSLATTVDPIDGRVALGNGMSGPTAVTKVLMEIDQLQKNKKYDLIDQKLAEIEKLYPSFPGAIAVRYEVSRQKGQLTEAASYAEQVLSAIPNDRRLLPVYEFLINHKIKGEKKGEAEKLALSAVRLDPENKALGDSFRALFGYEPTVSIDK